MTGPGIDRRSALRALCAAPAVALLPAGQVPAATEDDGTGMLRPDLRPPPCPPDYAEWKTWEPVYDVPDGQPPEQSDPGHLTPIPEPKRYSRDLSLVVRIECVKRGWPLERLADAMHWNRAEVRGWVEGRHDISCNVLYRLADAFGWNGNRKLMKALTDGIHPDDRLSRSL